MTGFLKYYKNPAKEPAHDRLCIGFANGYHLTYACQRKLGEVGFTEEPDKLIRQRKLGPDALSAELDVDFFRKILARSRGSIMGALMNQHMIAGLGNVYVDEILFQAGIHPKTKVTRLKAKTLDSLFQVMREDILPPEDQALTSRQRGGLTVR